MYSRLCTSTPPTALVHVQYISSMYAMVLCVAPNLPPPCRCHGGWSAPYMWHWQSWNPDEILMELRGYVFNWFLVGMRAHGAILSSGVDRAYPDCIPLRTRSAWRVLLRRRGSYVLRFVFGVGVSASLAPVLHVRRRFLFSVFGAGPAASPLCNTWPPLV